jgi:hypothetical protein
VLECDADAFACHASSYVTTHEKAGTTIHDIVGVTGWTPERASHVMYLVGVAALFRVLYPHAPRKIGVQQLSHPHPAIRAGVVSSCAVARSLADGKWSPSNLDALFSETVGNVESVWADLCLPGQPPEEPLLWATSVRRGINALLNSYEETRSLLERYSHLDRRWHDWQWHEPGK